MMHVYRKLPRASGHIIKVLAKMPIHSRYDSITIVLLTLRHTDNVRTDEGIRRYGNALGGPPCTNFLRAKQKEGRRRSRSGRARASSESDSEDERGTGAFQALSIYEILDIQSVFGGLWRIGETQWRLDDESLWHEVDEEQYKRSLPENREGDVLVSE